MTTRRPLISSKAAAALTLLMINVSGCSESPETIQLCGASIRLKADTSWYASDLLSPDESLYPYWALWNSSTSSVELTNLIEVDGTEIKYDTTTEGVHTSGVIELPECQAHFFLAGPLYVNDATFAPHWHFVLFLEPPPAGASLLTQGRSLRLPKDLRQV